MELELSTNGEIVEQILCITGSHTLTGHRAIVALKYQLIMLNKQFAFIVPKLKMIGCISFYMYNLEYV